MRAGPERSGSRLVRGGGLAGEEGHTRARHLCREFQEDETALPARLGDGNKNVPAENVTDRYAKRAAPDARAEIAKSASALKELRAALEAGPGSLAELADKSFAKIPLTKEDAAAARELLWKAHVARIKKERAAEVKNRLIKDGDLEMPFFYKTFGKKPKSGRSLWISLHGGGGAPKQVNDQQWENQKKLYKVDEGIYLAPRAPTNTWNLWHEPHIDRMFGRLIEDLIVLEDVNPNRVYVLGYSAGGDGVYQLAPRMADYWAGAAMMAGHPNGVSLLSLRNVPFALQVGANDAAYNRNKVGKQYGEILDKLQKDDPKGYEHFVKIHEGKGHWMNLEDKVALPWMAKYTRESRSRKKWCGSRPVPSTIAPTGSLFPPRRRRVIRSSSRRDPVRPSTSRPPRKCRSCSFDSTTACTDLDKPVQVKQAGKTLFTGIAPRTVATMVKTLAGRGDPELVFDAEVEVTLSEGK